MLYNYQCNIALYAYFHITLQTTQYKLVLVGDAEVGKSALSYRLSKGKFTPLYKPTIGAEYATILVSGCRFNIWDTAGQETYGRFITSTYYRGADCCAICYDLTKPSSLTNVLNWYEGIKKLDKLPLIILIGTKSDAHIEVEPSEIKEMSNKIGAQLSFVCSAKLGEGCDEIFTRLVSWFKVQELAPSIQNIEAEEFKVMKMQTQERVVKKSGCCD
ncbi:Rab11 [Hexamita inflata]|uniref:Rab11 n=1 Tax=Hexamita inflata TaxID=28002 RepID=A0AA86UT83_9EUKA|nr:Rab11 [Hexamita inflata]CAI9963927.1 Rab11 [Hexamita inflata]